MVTTQKYTMIKRFLLAYPKVREVGASFFLCLPLPFSAFTYRFMRQYVFKDNNTRMKTFEVAFATIAASPGSHDYLEFGVARGTSLISACQISARAGLSPRLFAFDSFEGLPSTEGLYIKGDYAYPQQVFTKFVSKAGVPLQRVHIVPGFYDKSLTPELYNKLGLTRGMHLVHMDSDLYASTKTALEWLTPLLDSGSVIIFDDWLGFADKPDPENYGEQRAFREWVDHANWKELHVEANWNIAFVRI